MKRIILHWTGGKYTPSSTDFEHYHFLVDKCGDILKGKYQNKLNLEIPKLFYGKLPKNIDDIQSMPLGIENGLSGIGLCAIL